MAKYLVVLCLLVASSLAAVPRRVIDPKINWRVIGGSNAPDGAHPHQISLQYFGSHSCGGSIVNNEWVITAAHCVAGDSPSYLTVLAGTNKLNSGGVSHQVLEIQYHENYDSWDIQNDVAILKVEPITYTDAIQPIVAESEDVAGDEVVTLSGWGSTVLWGPTPNDLQEIELKTITVAACQAAHSDPSDPPVIDSEICTLTKSGEGACHGDSGGPLTRTVDGVRRLVGIVSWGSPCARGEPDVFSRVSSFHGWFQDKCACL